MIVLLIQVLICVAFYLLFVAHRRIDRIERKLGIPKMRARELLGEEGSGS